MLSFKFDISSSRVSVLCVPAGLSWLYRAYRMPTHQVCPHTDHIYMYVYIYKYIYIYIYVIAYRMPTHQPTHQVRPVRI
jgi:hypothetical protein